MTGRRGMCTKGLGQPITANLPSVYLFSFAPHATSPPEADPLHLSKAIRVLPVLPLRLHRRTPPSPLRETLRPRPSRQNGQPKPRDPIRRCGSDERPACSVRSVAYRRRESGGFCPVASSTSTGRLR